MHKILKRSLAIAIVTSALLIGTQTFQWVIVDRFSALAMVLWQPLVGFLCFVSVCGSVFALKKRLGSDKWRAVLPLTVNVVAVLLAVNVHWTSIYLDYAWRHNERGYSEVVSIVQSGHLKPRSGSGMVQLPPRYAGLSSRGAILVEGKGASARVLFFTFVGVLDSYSGYIYVPGNAAPTGGFGDEWHGVECKKPHWYFVESS